MIFLRYTNDGLKRLIDFNELYKGQAAFLVGGAPSLKEQPIELLESRGVLSMAINNAALHFQPSMWVSGDNPNCYASRILKDPKIMKFAPGGGAELELFGQPFYKLSNLYFYANKPNIPFEEAFEFRPEVPWYQNSLFVGIIILYNLGIRTILLAGSDFGFEPEGEIYAHKTDTDDFHKFWNNNVYTYQVSELTKLRTIFEKHDLRLIDTSKNSKLKHAYEHMSLEEGVALASANIPFGEDGVGEIPHCSKFADDATMKKMKDAYAAYKNNKDTPFDYGAMFKKETGSEDMELVL